VRAALAIIAGSAGAARGQEAPPALPLRLTLAEAIQRALDEGTSARLATERVTEAEARALEAGSALRPQLSLGGQLANQSINLATFGFTPPPGEPNVTDPFNVVDAHVTLAMNIIDLAARRRFQAAQAGIRVSEEERRRNENEVAAAVASLYVSMGRSSSRIEDIRANVELFQRLRQIAVDQKNAGIGTRLDTTRADVQLARQQQALLVSTNQRDLARLALLRAIGADLDRDVVLTDDWSQQAAPVPPLAAALAAARQSRPELTVLERRLRAAALALEAVRAERLPAVGFQAQGTESGNRIQDVEWSRTVGAVVNVPLFTGRRIEARVAAARSQQQQILLEQRDTERQIEQEVRQALMVWQNARSRVELATQGVKLAEDELEQATDRFRAGVAPSIEVDNAQTSLSTARDTRIDALADEAQARFDLARATGGIRDLIPGGAAEQPQTDSKNDSKIDSKNSSKNPGTKNARYEGGSRNE
jgi:outer membrane protein